MASGSLVSTLRLVPLAPPWPVVPLPPPLRFHLHPCTPLAFPRPSGSTSVLCRSSSAAAFRIFTYTSVAKATCSALALQILGFTLAHRLSISASGSTTCSTALGWPIGAISPSSSMLPPSVVSTMGRHHGWGLVPPGSSKSLLSAPWLLPPSDPPWLLLAPLSIKSTLAPSVFSLDPRASACLVCLPSCKPFVVPPSPSLLHYLSMSPSVPPFVSTAQDRAFWEGRGRGQSVTPHWTFVVFSSLMCLLTRCLSFLD